MYKFIDTNETQQSSRLPSEALFINGRAIEDMIEGYRTLTVSGRELMGQELNATRRNTGDGSILLGASYPPRIITIKYELKTKDTADFRMKYEMLNRLLTGENKQLRFNDDYDYSFTGTLESVDKPPAGTNTVVSSFSFFCADPFKYGDLETIQGNNPSIIYDDAFPIKPDYIKVHMTGSTRDLILTTGKKKIKLLNYGLIAGEVVHFNFAEEDIRVIFQSGNSTGYLEGLSLDSDFEDFYMMSGAKVTTTAPATIEIGYRRKAL